jgi:hypothetical protein
MIFDAPLSLGGRAVCGHSISLQPAATPAAPLPDQPSYVIAAFCREDVPLTQLAGVMARTGVDDPVFRNFIGLVTLRLFPAFNPEARPDHDREPVIPEP